jgi:hypothetical protein
MQKNKSNTLFQKIQRICLFLCAFNTISTCFFTSSNSCSFCAQNVTVRTIYGIANAAYLETITNTQKAVRSQGRNNESEPVANEVLDYDTEECSVGDESEFHHKYMQTVIPRTHTISDSGNNKEQRTVKCVDEESVRLKGVSTKFVWEVINTILHHGRNSVVSTAHSLTYLTWIL